MLSLLNPTTSSSSSSTSPYLLLLIATFILYTICILKQNHRKKNEPPVSFSFIPFLGSAIAFGKDPIKFIQTQASNLKSSTFCATIAGERMVFLSDPSDWNEILRASPKVLAFITIQVDVSVKAFNLNRVASETVILGTAGHEIHRLYVKHLQGKEHLDSLVMRAQEYLHKALKPSSSTTLIPLFGILSPIIFKATIASLFGISHPLTTTEGMYQSFIDFDTPFPYLVGGAPFNLFAEAARGLKALTDTLNVREVPQDASDLLKARQTFCNTLNLTCEEVAVCQSTMIWASVANTIPAACWCLFYILRDPDAKSAILAEIKANVNAESGTIPVANLDSLQTLSSCVTETLRLTSSSMTLRHVSSDGYKFKNSETVLRGGDRVVIFPPLQHFDSKIWYNPEEFVYDRFLKNPELIAKVMPFGGGISKCPGRIFAAREVIAFIVAVFTSYESIELVDGSVKPPYDENRVGLGINQVKPGEDVMLRVTCKDKVA